MSGKPQKPKDSEQRVRRQRAPHPVILRLKTDLPENENHPLAALDPVTRAEQRQRVIASILARLANGSSSIPTAVVTMQEVRTDTEGRRDTNEPE